MFYIQQMRSKLPHFKFNQNWGIKGNESEKSCRSHFGRPRPTKAHLFRWGSARTSQGEDPSSFIGWPSNSHQFWCLNVIYVIYALLIICEFMTNIKFWIPIDLDKMPKPLSSKAFIDSQHMYTHTGGCLAEQTDRNMGASLCTKATSTTTRHPLTCIQGRTQKHTRMVWNWISFWTTHSTFWATVAPNNDVSSGQTQNSTFEKLMLMLRQENRNCL